MKDRHPDRRQDDSFACRQVQFDSGPAARSWRDRAGITEPALTANSAPWRLKDFEILPVARHLNARLLIHPGANFGEDPLQESFIQVGCIAHGEIEVFRKPVGFKEAFLEAGSALEEPAFCQLSMRGNGRQHPAKNIVFLHHVGTKGNPRGGIQDFAAINHWTRLSPSFLVPADATWRWCGGNRAGHRVWRFRLSIGRGWHSQALQLCQFVPQGSPGA
jgi:hypothetical protein